MLLLPSSYYILSAHACHVQTVYAFARVRRKIGWMLNGVDQLYIYIYIKRVV
jgi:hypothetical protein